MSFAHQFLRVGRSFEHSIIEMHNNNVMCEYGKYQKIFCGILLVPQNNVMHLYNVMRIASQSSRSILFNGQ